jgi:hypothetical protein
MIRNQIKHAGHPDRPISIQEALEPYYRQLVEDMEFHEISEEEVAVAFEALAQAHLSQMVERRNTEDAVDAARVSRGLPPVYRANGTHRPGTRWHFIGGAVSGLVIALVLWWLLP